MAKRIRKQKPKLHVVIPDTSTLWLKDKQHVADPKFDVFWDSYATDFSLEMKIPEVVRGELLFQQTTSALKSLKRANEAIKEVQSVTGKRYSHSVTNDRIKREVERKFDRWSATHHINIIPAPTDVIVWPELVHKAIWREPPFEYDPNNDKSEKGFRDAVILETLIHFCANDTRDIHIAFLCKDNLLRETAKHRLANDARVSVYELIEDFKTYLDLTKEEFEDAFINDIIRRASKKFFSKGDSECLYFRENLKGILKDKYKRHFDNPEETEQSALGLYFPRDVSSWEHLDGGTFWISKSRFVKKDADGQYVWQNSVTYVRQYASKDVLSILKEHRGREIRILVLPFFITWRAKVSSDGRFWEYSYLNDELKGKEFRIRMEDDARDWNLEG